MPLNDSIDWAKQLLVCVLGFKCVIGTIELLNFNLLFNQYYSEQTPHPLKNSVLIFFMVEIFYY